MLVYTEEDTFSKCFVSMLNVFSFFWSWSLILWIYASRNACIHRRRHLFQMFDFELACVFIILILVSSSVYTSISKCLYTQKKTPFPNVWFWTRLRFHNIIFGLFFCVYKHFEMLVFAEEDTFSECLISTFFTFPFYLVLVSSSANTRLQCVIFVTQ